MTLDDGTLRHVDFVLPYSNEFELKPTADSLASSDGIDIIFLPTKVGRGYGVIYDELQPFTPFDARMLKGDAEDWSYCEKRKKIH